MEIGKSRHWTSVFVCRCASNARCAQGQPKKEFQMNADWKVEKAQYAEFNVPTCGKIAVWQLCRERQPVWNSLDGRNLTCSDQCHGVLWLTPKNCCMVYSLNLIDEFTSLFSPKVIVAGLPRESLSCLCGHQCFSVVAHQDSPKAIPCQHGPTLQFVGCAEKDSLSGTVMMAWIWHVWINAMVLAPITQAAPKAEAKELL